MIHFLFVEERIKIRASFIVSMASFNHFVLLLLLIITLILSAEATKERRAIPSKAERNEMKRQLKAINKPAIKSFKVGLAFLNLTCLLFHI